MKHKQKTFCALRTKRAEEFDDADLFATSILATLSKASRVDGEQVIHHRGALSILHILCSGARSGFAQTFACFRPVFFELCMPGGLMSIDQIKETAGFNDVFSIPWPTYDERIRMFYEIWDDVPPSDQILHRFSLCTLLDWDIGDMTYGLLLSREKERKPLSGCDAYLQVMIIRWKGDLESPDCRWLSLISDRLLQNESTSYHSYTIYLCAKYHHARLLFDLCNSAYLLQALRTPEIISSSWKLITLVKVTKGSMDFQYMESLDQYERDIRSFIFLGALALPMCGMRTESNHLA